MVRRGGQRTRPLTRRRREVPSASEDRSDAEIYGELLDEVVSSRPTSRDGARPLKRRRVIPASKGSNEQHEALSSHNAPASRTVQTVDETQSSDDGGGGGDDDDDDDESDMDFEDVIIAPVTAEARPSQETHGGVQKDISLVLNRTEPASKRASASRNRRLPATAAEKQARLDVHKVHFCCLLGHCHVRNVWCNDEAVQDLLRPLIDSQILSRLQLRKSASQDERSSKFMAALQSLKDMWRINFTITESGLRKPQWTVGAQDAKMELLADETTHLTRDAFVKSARSLRGSRDLGAQLFCALLRSLGVDARLVCSFQVLSLNAMAAAAVREPPTPTKKTIYHTSTTLQQKQKSAENQIDSDGPQPIKKFGHSAARSAIRDTGVAPEIPSSKKKRIRDSPFPVFWIEVYDQAMQKWISLDPLVTQTINKPARLEPPASDDLNDMSYVIAFDDEYAAADVTRRYTKAYNAKTRKSRVESTKDGEKWLRKALKIFKRQIQTDQDEIERAELAAREAAEPMPRNIQDFKDHPYYALERHLRSHEMIHPKREVGKVGVGKGGEVTEPIYRRSDVQQVKTADKWYRLGREVKEGEQPLKYHIGKKPSTQRPLSDEEDEEDQCVGLYAHFQTETYIPPPLIRGKIPRNHFGNLDVYVPTMIPAGAAHVRAPEAAKASRILKIDYADAVVGFQFKGRRGTAVTRGAIVAREHLEAVEAVVRGLRWQKEREDDAKREAQSLRLWKRFLVGLRVRERIFREYGAAEEVDVKAKVDEEEDMQEREAAQGGFMPDIDTDMSYTDARDGGQKSATNDEQDRDEDMNEINNMDRPAARIALSDYLEPSILSPWDHTDTQHHSEVHHQSTTRNHGNPSHEKVVEQGGFFQDGEDENMATQAGGFLPDAEAAEHEPPAAEHMDESRSNPLADVDNNQPVPVYDTEMTLDDASDQVGAAFNQGAAQTSHPIGNDQAQDQLYQPESSAGNLLRNKSPQASDALNRPDGSEAGEAVAGGEDVDDDTSMLSHDPDDEDAEPDWLAEM